MTKQMFETNDKNMDLCRRACYLRGIVETAEGLDG
jgi:hypothetical protein